MSDTDSMLTLFKTILVVQLFYSFCITLLIYAMPASAISYVTGFSDSSGQFSLETVSAEVQNSLESQTNIPVIELGAMVFYSGNIIIDLLLNFLFAIPQMLGMLINGIMLLINVDTYIFAVVEMFASVIISVLYLIGLMQLLVSVRSGRVV